MGPANSSERAAAYREYLNSEHWRTIRRLVLERDGYACVLCGASGGQLEVHHRTYERGWYNERLEDLVVLCIPCHCAVENMLAKRKGTGG